jgi:gliding motility-associated-like protein
MFIRLRILVFGIFALVVLGAGDVLAQVGCGGFDGAPQPTGGPQSITNGQICLNKPGAPAQIRISAFNVADGNNPNNFGVEIDWDDGSPRQIVSFGGAITVNNTGLHAYDIPSITHVFLPRPCAARPGAECSYRPRVFLRIAGITCPAQFGTSPDFFRFNTDDQCSGDMDLSETVTGAPVFEVCAGASTVVTFTDRTILNCLPPEELTGLNFSKRWRRLVYGTTNTITGPVLIGGAAVVFPFTPPGMPEVSGEPLASSVPPFANNNTLTISIPATAQVGEEFHIRMDYWNFCNQFTDGDPAVFREGIIRVVDQPPPPTPVNQEVCNGITPLPNFQINFGAASSAVLWYQDNAGVPGAAVVNPNGGNNNTFPSSAFPGGITNTNPGIYRMWASYRSQVGAGALLCESIQVPVTITIRDAVLTPGPIAGTAAVCNGASGVGYGVAGPAGVLTPGGPTEFMWDVVDAGNAVVADVTLTPTSGQNAIAQNITAAFNIANGTFGGAASVVRKIRVRRRFVSPPNCQSPVVEFPVTISRNTDDGTITGGGPFCQGANLGNVTWNSPGWGAIQSWEIANAIGGPYAPIGSFGTANPVAPTSLSLAPGNYFIRARVRNGLCPEIPTDAAAFVINANPAISNAGLDDQVCILVGPLSYVLNGNAPGGGVTGLWTQVSGPGTSAFGNSALQNSTVVVSVTGIYVFRWSLTSGLCTSVDDVQVDIGSNPGTPNPTPADFCSLNGQLTAAPAGNETKAWTFVSGPPGGIATIDNPNLLTTDVSVNIYGSYVFNLTFSSGNCPLTPTQPVAINFFQPATSAPEPDKTVCVDGNVLPAPIAPFPVTGTVGGGATGGRWEIATGSGTFSSSGAAVGSVIPAGTINDSYIPSAADFAAGTVTLRLVGVHPQAVCGNVSNTVVITFDKKPALAAVIGSPFDVCGTTANLNAVVPTQGGTGVWSAITAGPGIADPANLTTAVSNLQFGPNVFRWTVTSAQGTCAPSTADFIINRTTAPIVVNLSPNDLCESVANTGIAQSVDLAASYDNLITGGAATVVTWFTNPARTVPVANVNDEDVSNGEIYYVRVSTTGIPVCSSDGVVNFTINPKPFVANLTPSLCEDVPGGGVVNNFVLTDFSDDVSLNAANRTVGWFTDSNVTVPVPNPADVDNISDGATFYARVENTTTGCFNVATVSYFINAIPTDNPIVGPNAVCLDPLDVIFFKVDQLKANHTYQWTIPPTVTVIGPTTDFYVLLQFPNAVPGGITIEVQETSPEGCPGNPQQLNISIEDNPGALVITGPDEVCEFATDVVYTVPLFANLTYAWSVPPGASIILGQGTEEIRVNFGNIPGDVIVTPSTSVGCVGPTATQAVAINRRPVMETLDKTICSQEDAAITLAVEAGSEPATDYNFIARVLDGGLFILNATTTPPLNPVSDNVLFTDRYENKTVTPLNVRYTVSGISAKGCEGSTGFITVRVNPEPQLNPALSRSVCSGAETEIALISAENTFPVDKFIINSINFPAGVTPIGPLPVADGVTLYDDNILFNNRWDNTTGINQVVSYEIIPYSTLISCSGLPSTVSVTIYPRTDVLPVNPTICNGDQLNVTFSSANNPDADFLWLVKSYDSFVTINSPAAGMGNIVNMNLTNTSTTQDGTVIFEVTGKNLPGEEGPSGCSNPIQTFTVTILKSPIANAQNLTACSDVPGGNTYTADLKILEPNITPDAGTPDTKITWYLTDPRIGPATIIPDGSLSAFVVTDAVPVFVEVEYLPTTCKKVIAVQYTVNPNLSVSNTISDYNGFNLNCNSDNSGEIRIDVLTGTPVYAYRIDGGPFINAGVVTYNFSSLAAGPHTIEVQDARGCTISQTIDLIEPPALTTTLNIQKEITCFLGKDGEISTLVGGGTGTYVSYLLLQTNNTDANNDGIFENLGAGSYNVRVTDSNNCKIDSNPVDLVQPTQVEINSMTVATDANGFNLSCRDALDGEIEVTFSGGNVPPNYTITLTKAADPLNPNIVNTPAFNATFPNLGFGNYTAIAADGKGCLSLPASAIIVNPPPFSPGFVGINQSICLGDDPSEIDELVPAFGGVGNYQYQWQQSLTGSNNDAEWINIPGAMNITFDPVVLAQTTYFRRIVSSVSERTGVACEILGKDNIVQIKINPIPVASFNAPSEVCQGEAFTLQLGISSGTAPIEYDYSAGAITFQNLIGTENTAIPISNFQEPTTYTLLRVKDLNGCLALNVPQSVSVDIIKINPEFTVLAPVAQCSGGTFTFQWVAEQGVMYTWIWSDGQQDIINPGDIPLGLNTITHVFTGGSTSSSTIYPVTLKAENALCAPKMATHPIEVFPTIVLNISPGNPVLCSGEAISFVDQSEGVDIGKWYYQEVGTTNQQEVRPGPLPSISYTLFNNTATNPILYEVVYEASNSEGCTDVYRKEVKVYRGISASIVNTPDPPQPFTGGISTVEFTNNSTPLDAADFEYTWDFGDVRAVPSTGTGVAPITVDYFSAGIKDVILKAVNIDALVIDNKTCQSVVVKQINIALPVVGAAFKATPLASCFPVDIVVENLSPGADTFLWELYNQSGLVTTSNLRNPVFRILSPGTYDIYLTASFYATGQSATAEQKGIEVFDVPTALFEMRPNPLYVPDTELQTYNQSARASIYLWDFDDGTTSTEFQPRHLYKLEGKYTVTLIAGFDYGSKDVDGDGVLDGNIVCYDTVRHELNALDGGFIKMPNAFTPNPNGPTGGIAGNGTFNDVFLPIARGIEEFTMQIFDRWGNLIFESRDRNVGWDGYDRNGRLMPAGVYVYKLVLRLSDGQRTTKIGDVTLIR